MTEKKVYEIPASVRENNEIEFNHELNEYVINKTDLYVNIPSHADIRKYESSDIVTILLGSCWLTLYPHANPHFTFFNFKG